MVVAEVIAHGRQVVRSPSYERACADARRGVAGDAIPIALGVLAAIDEETLLYGREVTAFLDDFLQERHGAQLDVARHLAERAVVIQGSSSLMPSSAAQVCLTVCTPRMLL